MASQFQQQQSSQTSPQMPPTELSAKMPEIQIDQSEIFADAQEQPIQRSISPGRAAALGHSNIAPPVHAVIDPTRVKSSRPSSRWSSFRSSRRSSASVSNASRSSSVSAFKEKETPMSASRAGSTASREVYGETSAQRAERKIREREFWDLTKPHFWNMVTAGYSGNTRH